MKIIILYLLIITGFTMAQNNEFANRLYFDYENYKENSLTTRRFKHSDVQDLINKLKNKSLFEVNKAGESAQGRDIYLIKAGTGKIKVFLWSQMHGDEPTATMALFDIFKFLSADDGYNDIKNNILNKLTLYFLPMVNPDGAELFQRRNIFDIDINRDASRQQTPEGKLLVQIFDSLKAEFGFNLHDQSTKYAAGNTFKSAAISFLAPAIDDKKSIDTVREKSMKLIGIMADILSSFAPGHIAKYSDEFEPRAFGDNFQKWGTSTILIESGGWKDDPEKQFLRKLNFISILTAFNSIANKNYRKEPLETYDRIPFNEEILKDLILRNVEYTYKGKKFITDIAVIRNEVPADGGNFYYQSLVDDIGDLSVFFGYEDYDLSGMEISHGKTSTEIYTFKDLRNLNYSKLYEKGITNLHVDNSNGRYSEFPCNLVISRKKEDDKISIGDPANFSIIKNGKVKFIVVNGFLFDVENNIGKIKNGIIIK